jgi:hypothetical protein
MATGSKAKRVQLGIIVSREMKARIAALARKSGRSQGQVAEDLMLRQFAYEELVAATRKRIEEIHKGNVETELYRLGYTLIRRADATGKVISREWLEPGSSRPLEPGELASQRGGFIPWDKGEQPSGGMELRSRWREDGTEEVEWAPIDDKGGEKEPKT